MTPASPNLTMVCDPTAYFDASTVSCRPTTCTIANGSMPRNSAAALGLNNAAAAFSGLNGGVSPYGYAPCSGMVSGQACPVACGRGFSLTTPFLL
eukprot:gene979-20966_t